jgi:hypothetical protein
MLYLLQQLAAFSTFETEVTGSPPFQVVFPSPVRHHQFPVCFFKGHNHM